MRCPLPLFQFKSLGNHLYLQIIFQNISEDLRSWFIRQEVNLFKLRIERESQAERARFLQQLHIELDEVSLNEKMELQEELRIASAVMDPENEIVYKVPWTQLLDVVTKRKCFLKNGFAYIGSRDQISFVVHAFKQHLIHQLELTSRLLPTLDEDERLLPVLTNMSKQYLGRDTFNQVNGKVTADDVDTLVTHFAPCMRHLQAQLKANGHLRYGGRMQYGLFLKVRLH
jgi:DNA primase large subunit